MPADKEPFEDEVFDDDYVPALFARNMEEAEEYCKLLDDHDIPARAGVDEAMLEDADPDQKAAERRGMTHGVPVLVPESLLDEASEVIADREGFAGYDEEDEDQDEEDEDDFGLAEVDEDELLAGPMLDEEDEEEEGEDAGFFDSYEEEDEEDF